MPRGFVAALATVVACAATSQSAAAVSSAEIVQLLSQQRETNGIPGGLAERPDWSKACAAHNHYQEQTGEFGHSENPSSPYYSEEGNWAAQSSVLARGPSWGEGNPWENAPIHLIQMLAPALSEMGAAETNGRNCATTWPGYNRPAPESPTAYSYPGDGAAGVVPTQHAAESPFVPGDFVGLPEGTATGRHLLVYLSGLATADASSVTATAGLSSTAGAADLRVVDSTHPDVGGYMPKPSAFLIPAQPLRPLTRYEAFVQWAAEGTPLLEQRFAFTTGTDPSEGSGQVRRLRSPCARFLQRARALRERALQARIRSARLARSAGSRAKRRRAAKLRRRSRRLAAEARRKARQGNRCHRAAA